jgi:hypothetical protein
LSTVQGLNVDRQSGENTRRENPGKETMMNEKTWIERQDAIGSPWTTKLKSRTEGALACAIAVLMTLQSAGGLFIRGLYRETVTMAAGWIGNDLVTLAVAVPLIVISAVFALKGFLRARLVYLGLLYFAFYNNLYYLFGTPFNRFFLVYEALLVLSAAALFLGLSKIPIARVGEAFKPGTPGKLISIFMVLVAAILGVLWIVDTASSTVTGTVPRMVTDNGFMTHLPAVFDLSLIVTPFLFGAIWLWQSRPWGYVVASIVLVYGALYPLVLIATAPFVTAAGVTGAWDQVPVWITLGAGCIFFAVLLLAHMRKTPSPNAQEPSALEHGRRMKEV